MSTASSVTTATPSRRALLAGALGGIGALAAGAIGRATPVRAAGDDGTPLAIAGTYADARGQTTLANATNNNTVLYVASNSGGGGGEGTAVLGYSAAGRGVHGWAPTGTGVRGESTTSFGVWGISSSYFGVYGQSDLGYGVRGYSSNSIGVEGRSDATEAPALRGHSLQGSTGVMGVSGTVVAAYKPMTGVYGFAGQTSASKGVFGESPNGRAIQGRVTDSLGYAGYFEGRVYTTRFYEMKEIANPTAPGSNRARLFIRDNGSGKTQLCVRFAAGSVQVLATQP